MRTKSERCVVTFPTTTAAMEMETACRAAELPGRLIPVPRAIAAGCGDAGEFKERVKAQYGGYSGDKYLEMTAGFFFP